MISNDEKFIGCFGTIMTLFMVSVLSVIVNGWLLTILWQWFVIPVFELPQLGISQAIGLMLITNFVIQASVSNKQDKSHDDKSISETLIITLTTIILTPIFVLSFGYIITLFL